MKIDDLLDIATPEASPTPTSASIRAAESARRSRRSAALVGVFVMTGGIGLWTTSAFQPGNAEVVDATSNPASVATTGPEAAELGAMGSAETASDETSSSTEPKANIAPPSQTRWFLAPPAGIEIPYIDDNDYLWSQAQREDISRGLTVTTDLQNPALGGQARVYHLDYAGVEITNGPEEFSETFRDEIIDGRTYRIGSDPERDSVKVFAQWDPGLIGVIGAGGITEEQAVAVALAARVEDGAVVIDTDLLPVEVSLDNQPAPNPNDHATRLSWGEERIGLTMRPGTLARAKLNFGFARPAVPVPVRSGTGVFYPAAPNMDPATLVWEEDGYQVALTVGTDQENRASEELVAIAEGLVRIEQPELVERFDDDFMREQPARVREWLEATPLPPGWDPEAHVHSVPSDEFTKARLVRTFISCAWGAEWLDALEQGDTTRRSAAFDVLRNRPVWPVYLAEVKAAELVLGTSSYSRTDGFDREIETLAAVTSADEVDPTQIEITCAFEDR